MIDMTRPFSPQLFELYHQFQKAPKEQQAKLAREIAETFASERDRLDHEGSEEYHEFFENFETVRLSYEHQAQKLTRVALHLIGHYLEHHPEVAQDGQSTQAN